MPLRRMDCKRTHIPCLLRSRGKLSSDVPGRSGMNFRTAPNPLQFPPDRIPGLVRCIGLAQWQPPHRGVDGNERMVLMNCTTPGLRSIRNFRGMTEPSRSLRSFSTVAQLGAPPKAVVLRGMANKVIKIRPPCRTANCIVSVSRQLGIRFAEIRISPGPQRTAAPATVGPRRTSWDGRCSLKSRKTGPSPGIAVRKNLHELPRIAARIPEQIGVFRSMKTTAIMRSHRRVTGRAEYLIWVQKLSQKFLSSADLSESLCASFRRNRVVRR